MWQHAKNRMPYLIAIVLLLVSAFPATLSLAQEMSEQVTFTGKVTDETGHPIAGADVTVYRTNQEYAHLFFNAGVVHEMTTQADGAVSVSVPQSKGYQPLTVLVRKEGYAIKWASWRGREDRQCDMVLGEPKQLSGLVVDSNGTPIPGADVSIVAGTIGQRPAEAEHLIASVSRIRLRAKTDASGRFTLDELPAEATFELGVEKPGYATVSSMRRSEYYQEKLAFSPGQTDIKLEMPAEAVIEGMVVEQGTGRPISDVIVTVQGSLIVPTMQPDPVITGADGRFRFDALVPDNHTLDLATSTSGVVEWVTRPQDVMLEAGQAKRDVKIEASKGGMLEVLVTEAGSGKPLKAAGINVQRSGQSRWLGATTDANGVARLRLLPGAHTLGGIYCAGYQYSQRQDSFTIEPDKVRRLTAELVVTPKLRGVVRDPDGEPVGGALVSLLPGAATDMKSDAQGRFEIDWGSGGWDLNDTVFCLVVRHEERNLAVAVEVGDGNKAIDLKLKPGVTFTGTTVDPNGEAIAGADVYEMLRVSNWGAPLRRDPIKSGNDGRFQIRAVPADHRYGIRANAQGYGEATADLETEGTAGKVVDAGTMTMALANLSIHGEVVDTEGSPIPGADIRGYGEGQPNRCFTQADAKGKFVLENVCAGQINLNVDATYQGKRLSAYVIANGEIDDVRIVVRQGRGPVQYIGNKTYEEIVRTAEKVIAGVALDERGKPVAGVPVGVCCHKRIREDGRASWLFSSFQTLKATTDAKGRFAIELAEDGQYNLLFSPLHHAAIIAYDIPVGKKDLTVTLPDGGTLTGRLVRLGTQGKVPISGAEVKLEQTSRISFTHLGFDRDRTTTTDAEGRFHFEHIRTKIHPDISRTEPNWKPIPRVWQLCYGDTTQTLTFGDDKVIDDFEFLIRPSLDDTGTLVGRSLPDFEGIEIGSEAVTQDNAVVICFFDYQQRPSRNAVLKLARQAQALKAKGIEVVAIQVSEVDRSTLDTWARKNSFIFPVGMITGNVDVVRAIWNAKSLPWLILTDESHRVLAEGFDLGRLDEKI